jgi:hypothetical protein
VVFLFAYLNLNRWHVRYAHITLVWLAFLGALVALALYEPPIASGIARVSLFVRRRCAGLRPRRLPVVPRL